MRVAVTGATGTIGGALVAELRERGDEVTALSRDAERASQKLGVPAEQWAAPTREEPPAEALRGRDAVVHLLGEPIAQRWSDEAKGEIRESRVLGTRNLVAALRALPEESDRACSSRAPAPASTDRAATRRWTNRPRPATTSPRAWSSSGRPRRGGAELGMRVVTTRTGPVLSEGGALGKMLPFFKLGVGGPVAGGNQYFSWIHLDDVVGAIAFLLDTEAADGPVNLTAPEPVTNKDFSHALGRVLHRPAFAPVPGLAVKLLYGEMAVIVTTGQRAIPARLTELGYKFRRPELENALREATERG